MKICKCDKCSEKFQIYIQEKILDHNKDDKIIEQFFVCPKCGAHYTVCIYDNYMRKLIAARKALAKGKYNRATDERLAQNLQKHLKELKNKYKWD